MSPKIGFGTYRITHRDPEHISSLIFALNSGIDLIDTSTNYMNGEAEEAIAIALGKVDTEIANKVEIVSKYGYIQGSRLIEYKAEEMLESTVQYAENCFHDISEKFLEKELSRSLERLNVACIDCYLIHNPEYYMLDYINRHTDDTFDKDYMIDSMLQRIFEAFIALEKEVQKGRIKSYGISSNAFSKHSSEQDFLEFESLIDLADEAARKAGNEVNSFTTIELPMNMLEQDGLDCIEWAKENGLRVLVNRALNAQLENHMFRLASYDEPKEYYTHLNALLEMCEDELLEPIKNLVNELDSVKHKFQFIGDFEPFYVNQVLPLLRTVMAKIDEKYVEVFVQSFDMFISSYKSMVAYECSLKTRKVLQSHLGESTRPIQEVALNFLRDIDDIDYILLGLRKPSYVADVL